MSTPVRVFVVDVVDPPIVHWPKGWPVPRVGECVIIGDGNEFYVRVIEWCPEGDSESSEPFVGVTLGSRR